MAVSKGVWGIVGSKYARLENTMFGYKQLHFAFSIPVRRIRSGNMDYTLDGF